MLMYVSSGAKPNTKRRQCVPCEGQGVVYVLRHMGNFITRFAGCSSLWRY